MNKNVLIAIVIAAAALIAYFILSSPAADDKKTTGGNTGGGAGGTGTSGIPGASGGSNNPLADLLSGVLTNQGTQAGPLSDMKDILVGKLQTKNYGIVTIYGRANNPSLHTIYVLADGTQVSPNSDLGKAIKSELQKIDVAVKV